MKRALLVEDHRLFREALAVMLEQHTDLKETLQAHSLGEACRLLADLGSTVDLAIVDLDLPEGESTELIEHLREEDVPVLAFTAERSLERRVWALRAGVGEVLSTACSGEQLIDTVEQLVSG